MKLFKDNKVAEEKEEKTFVPIYNDAKWQDKLKGFIKISCPDSNSIDITTSEGTGWRFYIMNMHAVEKAIDIQGDLEGTVFSTNSVRITVIVNDDRFGLGSISINLQGGENERGVIAFKSLEILQGLKITYLDKGREDSRMESTINWGLLDKRYLGYENQGI